MLSPCPGGQQRDRRSHALEAHGADRQRERQRLRQQLDFVQRSHHRQAGPFRRRHRRSRPKKPRRPEGHAPAHRPPPGHGASVYAVPLAECPHGHGPVQDKTVHVP